MNRPTVIDFFCGAGGFSEGFRQQGFEILMGVDNWKPAVDTFNHNFNLNCNVKNILDYEDSLEEIENLPDTDVIIGSPPCVSFSNSNKSGKADKALGIRLTEVFLKIVTIKKFKPNSKLKAWFMENVKNSIKHLPRQYTFTDLGLGEWARKHKIRPNKIALRIEGNSVLINSADYGSPQTRLRAITGEIISKGKLIVPPPTHKSSNEIWNLPEYRHLDFIKQSLPNPSSCKADVLISDPLYSNIVISQQDLTDHFYDTGLYMCEWKNSQFLKVNHPYMGRMSFPEAENRPSRTVTATKIGTSREALIYKSEYERNGDGEYRTPTIREAATIMSFPITYQFIGSESSKWRLAGNAVCPSVSRALAKVVRNSLKKAAIDVPIVQQLPNLDKVPNLNTYREKIFDKPPRRNAGSRFRRHPFKEGNMTVTLSNYDIIKNDKKSGKWITSVQYGNGDGFPSNNYPDNYYKRLEPIILEFENGKQFLEIINNGFTDRIAKSSELQKMYEDQASKENLLEPTLLIEEVVQIIERFDFANSDYIQNGLKIFSKYKVPKKQVMALYAVNKICTTTNNL